MTIAAEATDGSVGAVTAATDAVLASMTSAEAQDLEYAAGVAGVAVASSQYWTGYAAGGGSRPDTLPEPMMILRRWPLWAARLALIDVSGCIATAGVAYSTGTRSAGQLLGACGWGALGASGLAMM